MKGVQCYELFGGIALKIHTFSFFFIFINRFKTVVYVNLILVPGGDNLVKDVQCDELFGGIALENRAFSFFFIFIIIANVIIIIIIVISFITTINPIFQ